MSNKMKWSWIGPAIPWIEPLPVSEFPPRLLIDFATLCNLKCPMCIVWGSEDEQEISGVSGVMDLGAALRMLDEFGANTPMVQPNLWGEPTLIPYLEDAISALKDRGMPVVFNTNGLTLKSRIAKLVVDKEVDSVMFSIDATTPETLAKVRGVSNLDKIKKNIVKLMEVRGQELFPRIGVSFTLQDDNRHEYDEFINQWVGRVDVVRMGLLFDDTGGGFPDMNTPKKRKPCPTLYSTMPVHNDGTVRLCCLDGFRQTDMGNVFASGVQRIWRGEEFSKARYYHETEQWDKVPLCGNCNGWAEYDFEEEIVWDTDDQEDGLLIRRSPQYVYFNKISSLTNWKSETLGSHPNIPDQLLDVKKRSNGVEQ